MVSFGEGDEHISHVLSSGSGRRDWADFFLQVEWPFIPTCQGIASGSARVTRCHPAKAFHGRKTDPGLPAPGSRAELNTSIMTSQNTNRHAEKRFLQRSWNWPDKGIGLENGFADH